MSKNGINEYVFLDEQLSNMSIRDAQSENYFEFKAQDGEVLRLDKKGFHYKGQTIDDAGEAHNLFTSWMKKAMGQV